MSKPTITAIYPNPNQTSVPVGAEIQITFDQAVDYSTAIKSVILYGKDKDYVSGPEGAKWVSEGQASDPFFLRSPGFSGIVDCDYELIYVDSNGAEYTFNSPVLSADDEINAGVVSKLLIKPKNLMQEEMIYYLKIIGDSEGGASKGISKRTVYEVNTGNASSTDGAIIVYGGYTGSYDDILNIEIKTGGSIGEVDYNYWFDSAPSEVTTGKTASRRYRRLEEGLQIKFDGSGFNAGDLYSVKVYTPEFLENSYEMEFETSSDTIVEVPETMSTSPIGTHLSASQQLLDPYLELVEMDPENQSSNQLFKDGQIILTFNNELDSSTVTQESVKVYAYPVSGVYSDTREPQELFKKLTVSNNKIIIEV